MVLTVEDAAKKLASENARSNPSVSKILWFPDEHEIRLIEVDEESLLDQVNDVVSVFYFQSTKDFPFPLAMGLIHPDELFIKKLPSNWGNDWRTSVLIYDRSNHSLL